MKWDDINETTSRSDKGFQATRSAEGWNIRDIRGDYLTDCTGVACFQRLDTAKSFTQTVYKSAKAIYDREIRRQVKLATESK